MRLETKRLVLRDWAQKDIPDLVEGLNDLGVSRWLAFVPHPYTEQNATSWIDFCAAAEKKGEGRDSFEFAIELKSESKVIGGVSLTRISQIHQTAGGGIWLSSRYQGHGYGSEAFGEKIRFAFEDLNLRRLENGFFKGNEASFKMQERFGYKSEGEKRKAYRCMADGELRDECITALLKEDWIKGFQLSPADRPGGRRLALTVGRPKHDSTMNVDVDELVELDRLNMTSVIERAGGRFDPQLRRRKLLIEHERGAEFVCVGRQGKTAAYLEYIREPDGAWKVLSIQIHPAHQTGFILRDLLGEARERLLAHSPVAIHSSVHVTNDGSLNLHRKLGFEEIGRTGDRVLFSVDAPRLGKRLIHFHGRKTTANKSVQVTAPRFVDRGS